MDQTHHFSADHALPVWHEPEMARRELHELMEAFIRAAAEKNTAVGEENSALTLKVSAGVGKTRTAMKLLAKHGRALLARGHVLVYVPTLDLAERAAAELQALDSALPIAVIRGRLAVNPASGKPMCERSDLVESVTNLVPSVTQALCRLQKAGGIIEAPCARGCPYLSQKDAVGAKIHFLSHSYLEAFPPVDRDVDTALRIIDEKVWPTLVSVTDIYVEEFMRAPKSGFPPGLLTDLTMAKSGIVSALQIGCDVRAHLLSLGVDQEKLELLSNGEAASRNSLNIMPHDNSEKIKYLVSTYDRLALYASRKRQKLFSVLASDEQLGPNRLTVEDQRCASGIRQVIRLYSVSQPPRDAPLLMLDADADEAIAEKLVPGTDFAKIETKPQAEIVQISDRTLSDTWLLDLKNGTDRRAKIFKIIRGEVARADGDGVLIVATRSVLTKFHEDAGQPVGDNFDDDLRRDLIGATPRWFGPRMLGVNDFERYRTIVIVGRLQPGIEGIEEHARCLFSDAEAPLSQFTGGPLPEQKTVRVMHDGSLQTAKVRSHPDRRVEAVLRQSRECGTLQAIARLRLVSPDQPKRVVVLSSMPLLGLPISKLTTLEALYRGLENEPDLAAYLRMERALRATMGQSVCGTRVSAAGLAADLPEDFGGKNTAPEFRRGRNTIEILGLIERIAAKHKWPATRIELTMKARGGRATPAVVFAPKSQALAQASRLWAGFTARLAAP
ncbi:MAG: hypothetical protein ABJL57_00140 [Hyphomonas sp.]|uniref:hypothetical protein n=3 Tax=Alphaproteobacteria TaxID=28211 RepID=UPI0032978CB9